jgi:hypothetical protein
MKSQNINTQFLKCIDHGTSTILSSPNANHSINPLHYLFAPAKLVKPAIPLPSLHTARIYWQGYATHSFEIVSLVGNED